MTAPATDPAALLGALVDLVADAVVVRLRAAGPVFGSSTDAPSTWYTQDTSPLARRTYLALCRTAPSRAAAWARACWYAAQILDAWIAANGTQSTSPAAATPPPVTTPTNEQLMRAAGFSRVATRPSLTLAPPAAAGVEPGDAPNSPPARRARSAPSAATCRARAAGT